MMGGDSSSCRRCATNRACDPGAVPYLELDGGGRLRAFNVAAECVLGKLAVGASICDALRGAPTTSWIIQATPGADAAARLTPLIDADPHGDLLAAATTGIVARGITHDLNNLFTCILATATAPARGDTEPTRYLSAIRQAVLRGAELLNLLRELSLAEDLGPAELADIAESCGLLLERVGAKVGVTVRFDVSDATVALPPHELQQLVINLGLNAIDAMSAQGSGELAIRGGRSGDRVGITIADTGPGIAPERLAMLFAPGRSTKPGHSGVGLSVVQRIVRRAGGDITVDSVVGGGTQFRVELPGAREAS